MKVVRSIVAVGQRRRMPQTWRCSFAFFVSFLWHFNEEQLAKVIFLSSRPVFCKNQGNGAGKQWSVHAPLNHPCVWLTFRTLFCRQQMIVSYVPGPWQSATYQTLFGRDRRVLCMICQLCQRWCRALGEVKCSRLLLEECHSGKLSNVCIFINFSSVSPNNHYCITIVLNSSWSFNVLYTAYGPRGTN